MSGTTIYGSTAVCSPVGYFSGCVGIGTISPGARLEVVATGENVLKLKNSGGQPSLVRFNDTSTTLDPYIGSYGNDLAFGTYGGGEKMRITSTGVACFLSTVCSPAFVGGTISGTTGTFSGNVSVTVANTPEVLLTHSNTSKTFLMAVDGGNAFFRANSTNNILFQYAGGTNALSINGSNGAACFSSTVCTPYVSTNTIEVGGSATSPTTACIGYGMFGYSGVGLAISSGATGPNQGIGFFVCGIERGRWITSGNLGVGTVNPGGRLQIKASGAAGSTDALYIENSSSTGLLQVRDDGLLYMKGNVGIGATAPSSLLHICGAGTGAMLRLQNTTTVSGDQGPLIQFMSANQVGNQNFETGYIQSIWQAEGNAFGMRFATKGVDASQSEKMRITHAGITCFAGTVCAPCFATISDYRMKSNLRPIEGLSIIMNTKPYKFEYNYDCSTSFGMIAHELQEIIPEAVFGYKDGEVMQGVDYMKLLPIAIKAIQEQQCTINLLKSCIGIV
jgi:hypothetical protein